MRRTTRFGVGILAVGLLIGAYFGMPGFGPSGGSQVQLPSSETSSTTPESTENRRTTESEDDDEETIPVLERNVLQVLIEDRRYRVVTESNGIRGYQPIELTTLIDRAMRVSGNENGIRVRVATKKSARATAEIDLKNKLLEAGLREDEILWQKDLAP